VSTEVIHFYQIKSNDSKFLKKLFKVAMCVMLFTNLPFKVRGIFIIYLLRLLYCSI